MMSQLAIATDTIYSILTTGPSLHFSHAFISLFSCKPKLSFALAELKTVRDCDLIWSHILPIRFLVAIGFAILVQYILVVYQYIYSLQYSIPIVD